MKRKLFILLPVGFVALFVVAGIYAKVVPEVIELNDPGYKNHKKGIVLFKHAKHQKEYVEKYPDLYKNGCGECHHDKDNKPRTELKEGDDVKKCIECHKIASEAPKGRKAKKKLSKKEKIKDYQAEALHANCRDCHRILNKKFKPKKKAPTTCAKCHPKKK